MRNGISGNRLVRHALPLSVTAACLIFGIGGGPVAGALRYERTLVLSGEWWRVLSGNLVHLGWTHLLMNLAGLALIWLLFAHRMSNASWAGAIVISALATGVGLLLFNPELVWYVGLSGLLHGMFVAGLVAGLMNRERTDMLLLAMVCGKLAWEQWYGALPGSAETAGGPVIVDAHLYGAAGGLLFALIYAARRYWARQAQT